MENEGQTFFKSNLTYPSVSSPSVTKLKVALVDGRTCVLQVLTVNPKRAIVKDADADYQTTCISNTEYTQLVCF